MCSCQNGSSRLPVLKEVKAREWMDALPDRDEPGFVQELVSISTSYVSYILEMYLNRYPGPRFGWSVRRGSLILESPAFRGCRVSTV